VHLAATSLGWAELNGMAEALQHSYDGFAGGRKQHIVVARDEERNTQPLMYRKWVARAYAIYVSFGPGMARPLGVAQEELQPQYQTILQVPA
jgi:hypothetical protein